MKTRMRHFVCLAIIAIAPAGFSADVHSDSTTMPPDCCEAAPYVIVGGGVRTPGRYGWSEGMTVLDGVKAAGGFTTSAERRVKITRLDGKADLYDRLSDGEKAIALKAGDKVFVNQTFGQK